MKSIYRFIAVLAICVVTACATNPSVQEMNYLASALTKVSAAVDATARYRQPANGLPEAELLQLSTAHDPELMKPFNGLTIRVLRDGRDSAVLVCEARGGKALLEDAGCTAKLDQHRWNIGGVDRCEFTLDIKKACAR